MKNPIKWKFLINLNNLKINYQNNKIHKNIMKILIIKPINLKNKKLKEKDKLIKV